MGENKRVTIPVRGFNRLIGWCMSKFAYNDPLRDELERETIYMVCIRDVMYYKADSV